jgi:hypothetical protein
LRIGARNYSTHPTGQRACRRPANFIVAGQVLHLGWILVVVQSDLARQLMLPQAPKFQQRHSLQRE